ASELRRRGTATITMSVTSTCPYCRFGPIHSFEFLKICPICGGISLKEARFCRDCGAATNGARSQKPRPMDRLTYGSQ
ncbi:MAG: hypothetical protein ACETV0_08285, partial [Nitrososphaeria archaeon]